MTVGLVKHDEIIRSKAAGVGNHVVLIGSKTGRDGIGGASVLASQVFDETLEEKRPSVQVGDPFTEKKLLEACLELLRDDLLVALQDLGAAGITSSSSEMAAKGEVGIDLHADRVPLREADMEPWEIMISESQERMLAIVAPERWEGVKAVCDRWDLDATIVGEVTDTKHLRVFFGTARWWATWTPTPWPSRPPTTSPRSARPTRWTSRSTPPPIRPRSVPLERHPLRSHRLAQHRQPPLGVAAVRPSGAAQHRDRAGRRRRAPAHQEDRRRHRGLHRRQRPPDLPRSLSGRQGGGVRGGAQRVLRGREAHRHHQLPQLRQSRQRSHRLPAGADHRGHGRGLRGAGHSGDLGQRVALQRELRAAHLPDAGGGDAGPHGRRHAPTAPWPSRPRATWSTCWATRSRRWTARSTRSAGSADRGAGRPGASPTWTSTPRWRCRRRCGRPSRARLLRSAHDCSDGGLAVAVAECCMAGKIGAHPGSGRRALGGRQPRLRGCGGGGRGAHQRGRAAGERGPTWRSSARRPPWWWSRWRRETPTGFEDLCEAAGVPCTRLGVVGGAELAMTLSRADRTPTAPAGAGAAGHGRRPRTRSTSRPCAGLWGNDCRRSDARLPGRTTHPTTNAGCSPSTPPRWTSPASPSSPSSRCSTAGRSRPASRSPTAPG